MWLLIAFDIPTDCPKEYRQFRKELLSNGFIQLQKSLFGRLVESPERETTLRRKLRSRMGNGKFLFLAVSEKNMAAADIWQDGNSITLPPPPDPWIIF